MAPSAYLSSTAASAELVSAILPESSDTNLFPHTDAALEKWSEGHNGEPPAGAGAKIEKNWDGILTHNLANTLLDEAHDYQERSRLLAAMDKDSGAWLQALPLTSVGLRMDDSTLRILAVGLRPGTSICSPHLCQHCGTEVTARGTHGLSCRYSQGRHSRHAALNDIIHCTLSSAGIPSRLEPPGLSRSDGKRPDGVTLVPWSLGRPLVWDATCSDTFATSHRAHATQNAGCVAELAEARKAGKYAYLAPTHQFQPVSIETSGAIGPSSWSFLKELGRHVTAETGEARETSYLLQRLSVAIQRGNAAAVLGNVVLPTLTKS